MGVRKLPQSQGVAGIKETLKYMRDLIIESDETRTLKELARKIITGIAPRDEMGQVKAIFKWVQQNMKYVRDYYGVEELTRPDKIVYNILNGLDTHSSDCDDFAMVLAALLRAIGFQTRLEALAVNSPAGYDHARAAVFVKTLNRWVPLEGTRGTAVPGFGLKSQRAILGVEVF